MQHLTGTASNQVTGTRAGNRIRSVKEIVKSRTKRDWPGVDVAVLRATA